MRKKIALILILGLLLLGSCSTAPVSNTARTSLDWSGTYRNDQISITLNKNMTYRAVIDHVEVRSSFVWDTEGRTIFLQEFKPHCICKRFQVGENQLIPMKTRTKKFKDVEVLIKQ